MRRRPRDYPDLVHKILHEVLDELIDINVDTGEITSRMQSRLIKRSKVAQRNLYAVWPHALGFLHAHMLLDEECRAWT